SHVLPEMYSYYIVSDAAYQRLPQPDTVETSTAWMADKGQKDKIIQAGEAIFNKIGGYNFVPLIIPFIKSIKFTAQFCLSVYSSVLFCLYRLEASCTSGCIRILIRTKINSNRLPKWV